MKITKAYFSDFSKEQTLRNEYSYISYAKNISESESYSLLELFDIKKETDQDYLHNEFLYAEIGDVNNKNEVLPNKLNFSERQNDLENESLYKKIENKNIIKCQKNDILISKVRPNLKKIIFIENEKEDIYFTSAFICLRPKIIPKILFYALRTIFLNDILSLSRMGKGYPTISETDLKNLKFNKQIIHSLQKKEGELLKEIEKKENIIMKLKNKKEDELEIINNTFKNLISINDNIYEELQQKNIYTISLDAFSNDIDLRFSQKFQHPLRNFIEEELTKVTDKKIKDFITTPVMTGKSISPKDYTVTDEYRYIGMSDIKYWYINTDNMKYVSKEYFDNNKSKKPRGFKESFTTTVQKGDILMSRSGEGSIGKVALVDKNINAIFSDFIIRIRLNNYNTKFAYYFFRTKYFQMLIHIYKKGLGNNTNIFPNVIKNFPLLNIPMQLQNSVVENIDNILDKNNIIERRIEKLTIKIENKVIDYQ